MKFNYFNNTGGLNKFSSIASLNESEISTDLFDCKNIISALSGNLKSFYIPDNHFNNKITGKESIHGLELGHNLIDTYFILTSNGICKAKYNESDKLELSDPIDIKIKPLLENIDFDKTNKMRFSRLDASDYIFTFPLKGNTEITLFYSDFHCSWFLLHPDKNESYFQTPWFTFSNPEQLKKLFNLSVWTPECSFNAEIFINWSNEAVINKDFTVGTDELKIKRIHIAKDIDFSSISIKFSKKDFDLNIVGFSFEVEDTANA